MMRKGQAMRFKSKRLFRILIIAGFCIVGSASKPFYGESYIPGDTLLYNTIFQQDSILFNAFNSRDYDKFKRFFSSDLEIYQDNIGVRDFNQSMDAFQGLFQGDYVLTRTLLKESLEVYPIKDFGAIEIGQHTFCHVENGILDCGTYKFVHIWENQNGVWKIIRIITFNH